MDLPTIFCHGHKYDPAGPDHLNPHKTLYKHWGEQVPGKTIPFSWYSVPFTFPHILKSWRHGYLTPWGWAWRLTYPASNRLQMAIQATGDCNIVCHSLGAKVVLNTLARQLPQVKKVIILNGAEYISTARIVANSAPYTEFWNFITPEDDALAWFRRVRWGEDFIGQRGIQQDTPFNWHDNYLDCSNHSCSHKHKDNWDHYRLILSPDTTST